MPVPFSALLLLLSLLSLAWPDRAGAIAQFYGLGDFPGFPNNSYAYAVSADGSTAAGTGAHSGLEYEAFVWDPVNGMQGLGVADGYTSSAAFGLSGDGSVAVGNFTTSGGTHMAALWTPTGEMLELGVLPGRTDSSAFGGVSADGSVVAGYSYKVDSGQLSGFEGFVWDATNGMRGLGQLPGGTSSSVWAISADGSTIVGEGSSSSGHEAWIWDATNGIRGLGDLAGDGFASAAHDVSADGSIVVGYGSSVYNQSEAFIWDAADGMRGLGGLPGGNGWSHATVVSADGSIVLGSARTASGPFVPFIWDAENGMQRLDDFFVSQGIDLGDWSLDGIEDVSADGQTFVGWGINPDGDVEAWYAVIPEPATGAMLCLGLVALVARRRIARGC
jgi:probable HAF family extracellular repeat protein